MRKKKHVYDLEKQGWELVPGTVGCIIDSIWHQVQNQVPQAEHSLLNH